MTKRILKKTLPYLALLAAHLIWGANFLVAKVTLAEIPPMSLSFLRFLFASILLIPFLLIEKKRRRIKIKDLPRLILSGIFLTTLNIAFFYEGLLKTTIIQASVLTLTVPMFSVLLAWWFLKEKIYVVNILGLVVGMIGASTIIGLPLILFKSFDLQNLLGNLLIILASLSWVIGAIISKSISKKYSTLDLTAFIFAVGTLTFLLPALSDFLHDPSWVYHISFLGLLGLIYIILLSSISAYFLFEWGLARVGVYLADIFQYLQPFIAASLGILVLGESLRFTYLIGGILIILGVYWGTFAKESFHKHHRAHRI